MQQLCIIIIVVVVIVALTIIMITEFLLLSSHVRWVLCHHGMACPQVADGETASRYGG
jgi:flagellar basal body-associated protein FliL